MQKSGGWADTEGLWAPNSAHRVCMQSWSQNERLVDTENSRVATFYFILCAPSGPCGR